MAPEINTSFSSYTSLVVAILSHCIPQFDTSSRPLEIIHFPLVLENFSVQTTHGKIISGTQVCISQLDALSFKPYAIAFKSAIISFWVVLSCH